MTAISVRKDPDALTFTLDAEFAAPPQRVWLLWADARQLERWWGPPTYPATVTAHTLAPGGRVEYYMTSPDGDRYRGYWDILEVDPPSSLVFRDGFANGDGSANMEMPTTRSQVTIQALGDGRTRMSIESVFADTEAMERILSMGMEEGIIAAVGQISEILAESVVPGSRA